MRTCLKIAVFEIGVLKSGHTSGSKHFSGMLWFRQFGMEISFCRIFGITAKEYGQGVKKGKHILCGILQNAAVCRYVMKSEKFTVNIYRRLKKWI